MRVRTYNFLLTFCYELFLADERSESYLIGQKHNSMFHEVQRLDTRNIKGRPEYRQVAS